MHETKKPDEERQAYLHREFTEKEEAYHSAYPNVRTPYIDSILLALTSRYRRGFLLFGLVGVLAAVGIWLILGGIWH